MARAAKKEIPLTTEEKLAKALVPKEEQPYPVPENWCWVRLGGITSIVSGGTPSTTKKSYYENGTIPWISPSDLSNHKDMYISRGAKNITELGLSKSSARLLPANSVCLSTRAPIGYVVIASNSLATNQGFKSFLPSPAFCPHYLFWYLKGSKELLENMASGTTFLELSGKKAANITIPLPPLSEQKRIVALIESLFANLDAAKEKLQAIMEEFAYRRAAILHRAFTGELTAKWREEKGIGIESWNEKTLQAVCKTKITDGTHKTPTYSTKEEGGVPFISSKDITKEEICWDNIKYIVPELHEELFSRLAPQRDDVLLAKNGTTGVAAIVDTDMVFDVYVTLAVLRPDKDIICPRFLLRVVNSPLCKRQFDEHLTGIGLPNLHLRDIKEVIINVPSISEQKEIVRILDDIFAKESHSRAAVEAALTEIDTLKKTILTTAFRGGFETNDSSDESAEELLRRVL